MRPQSPTHQATDLLTPSTAFGRAITQWTLIGLALSLAYFVAGDPGRLVGPGSGTAWLWAVRSMTEWMAILIALAALAAGLAFEGESQEAGSWMSLSRLVRPALLAAGIAYLLISVLHPWVEYGTAEAAGTSISDRFPLGPQTPWTLWALRSYVVEHALGGSGPITPKVRGQLAGLELHYGLAVAALAFLNAFAGYLIGSFGRDSKPGVIGLLSWMYTAAIVGSLVLGVRIAVDLVTMAAWSAEAVALLPLVVPLTVMAVLLLTHAARLRSRARGDP